MRRRRRTLTALGRGVVTGLVAVAVIGVASAGYVPSSVFLQVANNLSDLLSPSTARTNLGLGTMSTQNTGISVVNPGTNTIEAVLPVQTAVGASKTFGTADLFQKTRRSNSGSAMADTLPTSTTTGIVNGSRLDIANVDASASDTLTAGAGTSIAVGCSTVVAGQDVMLVYDLANTTWRGDGNTCIQGGSALTAANDTNVTLTLGGAPTTALLHAASVTLGWTGTLSVVRGGTASSTLTAHAVLLGEGTSALGSATVGTQYRLLADQGSSADPVFSTLTSLIDNALSCATQGDILYRGASGWNCLGPGTSGQYLGTGGASTNPSWSGIPPYINFLGGLVLSNDGGAPNNVLDIEAGAANDSTNAVVISLGAFTKSTAGSWASGSGSNGMGNGLTIANSTWYHVCLANNSGTPDIWFDTSVTCGNKPTGITDTKYRRIGSFFTDGSAHIIKFSQNGDEFLWLVDQAAAFNPYSVTTTQTPGPVAVPTGVKVIARLRTLFSSTSMNEVLISSPDQSTVAGASIGLDATLLGQQGDLATIDVRTNTSAQINIVASTATGSLYVYTYGWIDTRGKLN